MDNFWYKRSSVTWKFKRNKKRSFSVTKHPILEFFWFMKWSYVGLQSGRADFSMYCLFNKYKFFSWTRSAEKNWLGQSKLCAGLYFYTHNLNDRIIRFGFAVSEKCHFSFLKSSIPWTWCLSYARLPPMWFSFTFKANFSPLI